MQYATPILCLLLALAAAGRYRAEADVRDARIDLAETRAALAAEAEEEARLRLEVEVLESASRFEEVNKSTLRLEPARPDQLTSTAEFARAIGKPVPAVKRPRGDLIGSAITMADPAAAPVGDGGAR